VLDELVVKDLGVIESLSLQLGPGLTALTGETGAGKTLLIEAIELLVGARAEPLLVRPGADEARVDGRFTLDGDEVVVSRVVPREGRSRAYVDGRAASLAEVAELGERLVDLHGQHAHQSLLHPLAQRQALDAFAGTDLGPLRAASAEVAGLEAELSTLGGDDRSRAREADLLRFQLEEIAAAALQGPDEVGALDEEEDLLADAQAHQEAAAAAHEALAGESGAADFVAMAIGAVRDRPPFADLEERARGLHAELAELAVELRDRGEAIEPDPERLAEVRARRQLLKELCRKYGDGADGPEGVTAVEAYGQELATRLAALEGHEARAAALAGELAAARERLAAAQAEVGATRRAAAPALGEAVGAHLADLAMAKARLAVEVEAADPGDAVTFLLAANPGAPLLPLAKVASGGELARAMLALRLVLVGVAVGGAAPGAAAPGAGAPGGGAGAGARAGAAAAASGRDGPATLVFDEVDAGIGGTAAQAVGEALAQLAEGRQVLVVTHLAQVAAWAGAHVSVEKAQGEATTVSEARSLGEDQRVVELARMLSGSPGSETARRHAAELLDASARRRR
jgi:DNA repair protein RecN (Recombination protein N)